MLLLIVYCYLFIDVSSLVSATYMQMCNVIVHLMNKLLQTYIVVVFGTVIVTHEETPLVV